MKKLIQSFKRQDGFTLVELMVVVAIIGLLSAVAIPNFKKYQARSKITEAKLQLSALYTAEQSFFSDYNMYANCLRYMGFDPYNERTARFFAIGFPRDSTARNAEASTSAQNAGMILASCPDAGVAVLAADTTTQTASYFGAGKGVGGAIIDSTAEAQANPAGAAVAVCSAGSLDAATEFGTCVGSQADATTMTFQAVAVGVISGDNATDATAAGFNISQDKVIKQANQGY